MRVLFDTNIFVSYLLSNSQSSTISAIIEAGLVGKYKLLLPYDVFKELSRKIVEKPYLAAHILSSQSDELANILSLVAERIPPITSPIPTLSRDKKDDYLLAYALVGEADYIVSGDKDLLIIKNIENVTILSPAEFFEILRNNE